MAYRFDSFYIGGAWAKPSTTDVLTLENPATRAKHGMMMLDEMLSADQKQQAQTLNMREILCK